MVFLITYNLVGTFINLRVMINFCYVKEIKAYNKWLNKPQFPVYKYEIYTI